MECIDFIFTHCDEWLTELCLWPKLNLKWVIKWGCLLPSKVVTLLECRFHLELVFGFAPGSVCRGTFIYPTWSHNYVLPWWASQTVLWTASSKGKNFLRKEKRTFSRIRNLGQSHRGGIPLPDYTEVQCVPPVRSNQIRKWYTTFIENKINARVELSPSL